VETGITAPSAGTATSTSSSAASSDRFTY
jgi:hypothetical protein